MRGPAARRAAIWVEGAPAQYRRWPTRQAMWGGDSVGIATRRETVSSARWASLILHVTEDGRPALSWHGPPAPVEAPLYPCVSGWHLNLGNLSKTGVV